MEVGLEPSSPARANLLGPSTHPRLPAWVRRGVTRACSGQGRGGLHLGYWWYLGDADLELGRKGKGDVLCRACSRLLLLSGRLPLNSRLLVVMLWGESTMSLRFLTAQGSAPLTPVFFKGQLSFSVYVHPTVDGPLGLRGLGPSPG